MGLARLSRRLEAMANLSAVRWAFFSLLAATAAWPWLRTAGSFNDFRDANVLWLYEDAARRSVLDFGQLPLWNPDFCGGLPALGTPQSRFASPAFLLTLLFGTTRAEPVTLFFMLLLGLGGAHRYARELRASQLASTLAAPVFGLMGVFACAPFLGWFGFLGFALLPWALVGTRLAARGAVSGSAMIGVCVAWMVGFGGTYVAPISLVACGLEVVTLAIARRGRLRWATLALAGVLSVELSAFRLWPVWEELQRAPRLVAGLSSLDLNALGGSLFGAWPILRAESWYLVTVPAAVVAGLALLRPKRRVVSLAVAFGFWLWIASGSSPRWSAWDFLRGLPLFSLLRNSERFLVPAALVLATAAALALTSFQARLRLGRRTARFERLSRTGWLVSVVGLLGALAWLTGNFFVAASHRTMTAPPAEAQRPFHQARGNRWAAAQFGPMARGSLACWEAYTVPQSPRLRGDLVHESWLADASAGDLQETRWTPQRLDFQASLARPTRLVINQNFHRGWRSTVGAVVSEDGLLAVELPAGSHAITLRFAPVSAIGGLLTSALAVLGCLWLLTRRRGRAIAVLAPLLAGALVAMTSPEPPLPARLPVGPENEPVVVDELPTTATRLGVRFRDGVVLEGAQVSWRAEDDRVRVELDWSHDPLLNRKLGFFVHIEPGSTKRITADHLQVSDTVFLEQTPAGKVLRDIMLIDVPETKRAESWNVWVGLWEMRGNGERIPVVDARGANVADQRVLVGSVKPGARP